MSYVFKNLDTSSSVDIRRRILRLHNLAYYFYSCSNVMRLLNKSEFINE